MKVSMSALVSVAILAAGFGAISAFYAARVFYPTHLLMLSPVPAAAHVPAEKIRFHSGVL